MGGKKPHENAFPSQNFVPSILKLSFLKHLITEKFLMLFPFSIFWPPNSVPIPATPKFKSWSGFSLCSFKKEKGTIWRERGSSVWRRHNSLKIGVKVLLFWRKFNLGLALFFISSPLCCVCKQLQKFKLKPT